MRTRQVKDIELRDEWKRIDEALISPELMADLPQPECTALTLLVDAMINSTVCDLGPAQGQIMAMVDDEISIILDVEETVRNRISRNQQKRVYRNLPGGLAAPETYATAMEIFAFKPSDTGPLDLQGRAKFPNGAKFPACVHGPKASIPALDDCASFVYWAEAGFPNPPSTISDAIMHARDPVASRDALALRIRTRREARRLMRLRQELTLEIQRAKQRKEEEAEAERQRIMSLGWRGLIEEHRNNGLPITGDDMLDGRRSDISHMLRESLLDPEARSRARDKSRAARESQENLQQKRFYRNVRERRNDENE